MAKGIGIKGALQSIKSANGTAQYLLFAWWGMVFSGMLVGMHTHTLAIIALALCSAFVYYSAIFLCRQWIKRAILTTTFVSVAIAADFMYGTCKDHGQFLYDIRHTTYYLAFITMFNHGFYLSHLLTRQILEAKRILGDIPCR
jgi:hypothetical protein